MTSPQGAATAQKRTCIVVLGAAGPEDLLNQVLEPRGFAPVVFVASIADLTLQVRSKSPALVIVPVAESASASDLAQFEAELRRHPGTAAIATAAVKHADTVINAMRAGITEFMVTPTDVGEFTAAVSRVLSHRAGTAQAGRIYTVYSGKGGVGTSTIAASLAWALSQGHDGETALVDFNTAGAGLRVMLNLNPAYDLGNVAARADRLDRDYLRSVMTAVPDRVAALPAADELDAIEPLDARTSGRLLELLRQDYPFTVLDTDHHFNDQTLAALDAADRILLVTQFDVSALRSTQRSLGVFARLGYPADKVVIVANRRTDRDRITVSGAERVLGQEIAYRLPNDYTSCSSAITQGEFVQRHAPASPLVASFRSMASGLSGHVPASNGNAPEKSRLARMFSRKSS